MGAASSFQAASNGWTYDPTTKVWKPPYKPATQFAILVWGPTFNHHRIETVACVPCLNRFENYILRGSKHRHDNRVYKRIPIGARLGSTKKNPKGRCKFCGRRSKQF